MQIQNITIIGLGLIGGSIAKALKSKSYIQNVIGIDPSDTVIQQALKDGSINKGSKDLVPDIRRSDVVFLCTPVSKTCELVEKLIPLLNDNCIITDVGSTKSQLLEDIENMPGSFHFVGGHPMAGSEKSGYMASSPHLFENAYYIITPCSKSSGNDVEILTEIIKALGGIPIKLSASLHDKVTGAISHVPHIISAALVKLVQELDSPEQYMQKLAAGGFKDITRISSSNPEMWHNICFSNRESVIKILDDYIEILINFKKSLSTDDDEKVFNYFKNAKEYRDSFTSRMNGLIPGTYELIIDVADKPGIIGEVATTLGNNDINIKNINITNSREFEGGVLIVTLSDSTSLEKAELILSACDYKIIKRK